MPDFGPNTKRGRLFTESKNLSGFLTKNNIHPYLCVGEGGLFSVNKFNKNGSVAANG